MRILITGANGYIGSRVVKSLLDMGNEVIATDISNEHIDNRADFIKANLFEDQDFYNLFKKPDVCLHLAWRDGFVHNSLNHIKDLSSHFKFLTSLIDAGIKQIAVMGSMHEVGYWEGKIDENTPTNPKTYYGIAKDTLRKSLSIYCQDKNVVFQWLRAYYIYGNDSFGNSIFCKIRKASEEGVEKFPFTTGKNQFDFISIDELSNQISQTITQKSISGVINVCSGTPISLADKIEWYIKQNGLKISLDYGKFPERATESPCIYGDNEKIKEILKSKEQKILVTGAKGQLGTECILELKKRGFSNVKGIDIEDLDITNEKAVKEYIKNYKPDVVMHNAAWTAVDKAEQMADKVFEINANGPKFIAEACNEIGAKIVYISTDYVFGGVGTNELEIDDAKNGDSVYAKSKLQGEENVQTATKKYFIVRTSWVFGNGNNFVRTMLRLADMGKTELSVVDDQIGSVTYTKDLAVLLCDMIETEKYGIYHATNEGYISWADFAKEIFKLTGRNVIVHPVTTEEYKKLVPNQAARPLNSRLSKKSLDDAGFNRLPKWEDALSRYLKENELI